VPSENDDDDAVDAWDGLKGPNATEPGPHIAREEKRENATTVIGTGRIEPFAVTDLVVGALLGAPHKFPPVIPEDLHLTRPPQRTSSGLVKCDRCEVDVRYGSMVISEHGYLCKDCGDALARAGLI
jgi:hypothetical protein